MHPDDDVFGDALALPASERATFVVHACGSDHALRVRVEAMLALHDEAPDFLTVPLTARPAVMPEEKAGDVIGRYKLLQKIAEGGMGVVYLAGQEEPVRRRVALKIIKLGMDTKSVIARFEAERQALALMDHPNIARVFDGGATETGRPYFVMELVRGVRITQYCDDAGLSTHARIELFIQVCQAIQHAHQKGIIHRDIKPSNILVTVNDGVAVPKVIDFGIAKAIEGRLTDTTLVTQFEALIGTPSYMSPEQTVMTSVDVDTRSDIYSLGALLYEMLAGRTPFDAKELLAAGLDEMRKTIREKEPVRPSTRLSTLDGEDLTTTAKRRSTDTSKLLSELQGDLDWIVMKCLEKDRARRYQTANGLSADLKRYLNDEAVTARPPSAAYRCQKLVKRNKLAFAAAGAVTLTLVAGLSISTWAFLSEAAQRRTAVDEQRKAEAARVSEAGQRMKADAEKIAAERNLYVANMNLAQQAWEQNNIPRLRQLLEETQASPDRGFEWNYWLRQSHLALKTLRGHSDWVTSVASSPDCQRIVTGSTDHTAKVWDVASGRELHTLIGHSAQIYSVAFSADGRQIVTGSYDYTAKVWNAVSGQYLRTLKGHVDQVRSVAFSPDGKRIVTGSWDQTARVWDAADGRELFTLRGHSEVIRSVAYSPDGLRIVTGSDDKTARIWEATGGRELHTLEGHAGEVWAVAFSPDSKRIVTGSWDHTANVWEAASGQMLITLKGHTNMILAVAFSADGQRIVTGSFDKMAKVWDPNSGRELRTLKGHSAQIYAVAFSADDQQIITGSGDRTAKVWQASDPEVITFTGHTAGIRSVAFSPDGGRIVTGSGDKTAKVWKVADGLADSKSGRELLSFEQHTGLIWSVAFSPNGERIVAASDDQTATVWEAASGQEVFTLKGHKAPIWSANFSPDGQRIVTGSSDGTAKVWDAARGSELLSLIGHSGGIRLAVFSPDNRWIATASIDRTAKVWEAASGSELLSLTGHSAPVGSVAFSPDGRRVVTASDDQTAKVWEAASGRELFRLEGHSGAIKSAAFSPDGARIVTGSEDQTAKVWETVTGRELLTLKGHDAAIESAAFSPDGLRIATGSEDETVRVWQAARPKQVAAWLVDERAGASSLAALPRKRIAEGARQQLARARDEGAIKRWLILAPIALTTHQSTAEGLDAEQIAGEALLRPKAGEGARVGSGELKWQEVTQPDYVVDFHMVLRQQTNRSVAYAVCYILSEAAQHGLQMLVGSDDEAKVYLNGKPIYRSPFRHRFVADQDKVEGINLDAGPNVLVIKVANERFFWQGSVRFTDAQGDPVKGIKVTLTP